MPLVTHMKVRRQGLARLRKRGGGAVCKINNKGFSRGNDFATFIFVVPRHVMHPVFLVIFLAEVIFFFHGRHVPDPVGLINSCFAGRRQPGDLRRRWLSLWTFGGCASICL